MVDSWKHNLAAQATNQVAIGAYWKKYQEEASYLELALYASILPALNFSLLSSLAQNFLSERTPLHLLVSDFLQSSLCTPIGQGVYEIYPDVKQNLRQALSESDPDNQITYRLAHFIDYYVKEMGEEIPTPALEEALTWTSKIILNPTSFAEDLLRNQEREQYATVKYMVRLVRSLTTSGKTLENGRRSALTVAVQFIEGMNQFDLENSLEANRALKALGPNISLEAISQSEGFKTEVPLELWEQLQNRDNELNILESLPPEIRSMDQDSIRAYLESIQTMPTVSNYEANVYILGDAGVGKTSLIRILENHINPSSESWEPTSDRDSAKWFFPLDEGHALYAEPVSFGGQFLLHGGYKLILRPHSLYIIMVDDRRDADRSLRNWIEVTQKYGKDEGGTYSPIMIIQNNKRSTTASLNLENIEKEYPNLQIEVRSGNIIDLSNKLEGFLNNRLDRIANDIRDTLLKLPSIGARIPLAWQGIQEELEKQKERNSYISFQEFWKICREHNLMREADVKILADYLHTKGSIGYYKHIQGLEEVIILNIGWIW
ncbi:MAG: COR domain-containing protein, partial [Bacteroidota bacterium]